MPLQNSEMLTPREAQIMQAEREENELSRVHELALKDRDIELAKLELKWTQLFKIPLAVIAIPIRVVASLALCISYARKQEPSDNFWKYLR